MTLENIAVVSLCVLIVILILAAVAHGLMAWRFLDIIRDFYYLTKGYYTIAESQTREVKRSTDVAKQAGENVKHAAEQAERTTEEAVKTTEAIKTIAAGMTTGSTTDADKLPTIPGSGSFPQFKPPDKGK